jgi:tricorn protease
MAIASLLLAAGAHAQSGYFRYPAINADTVVFTAEGDLWKVGAEGGAAVRLTSHPGQETHAAISPDGSQVAFCAAYEGPVEVYVMPTAGGLPTRLTFGEESTEVEGWTPDGLILFHTHHYSTLRDDQLVALNPKTLEKTFIPLAQASEGSYEDSGSTLYFTRFGFQGSLQKRYHGGTAQSIWRFGANQPEAVPLTADYSGTSRWPMWSKGRVFFVSDRDGTMNLWSMKPDGTDLRQHTRHADYGIKNPSLGGGRIVYQNGADLWLYDIGKGTDSVIPISLTSDFDQMRERWVTKPVDHLSSLDFSPTGDRLALTVRGRVFVVPTSQGRLAEITRQSGVRYRSAVFMPDGKSLLFLGDESGEVEFETAAANGVGAVEALTKGATNTRLEGRPSPDGKWILFNQKDNTLWIHNFSTGETRKIATSSANSDGFNPLEASWSGDSQWVAYVDAAAKINSVIFLYNLATGVSTPVTSERVNSTEPVFSPDGKWLYFLSDRSFHSPVGQPWGNAQPEPFFDKPTKIYQIALGLESRSPFQPNDELAPSDKADEPEADPSAKKDSKAVGADADADPKPKPVVVVLEGIKDRLWEVPVPAGRYEDLFVTDKALYLLDDELTNEKDETHKRLVAVEIKPKDPEVATIRPDVKDLMVSRDGKKLLIREDDDFFVTDAVTASIDSLDKDKVSLDALKFSYVPRDDWKQIYTDAWRMHRDYFYDKNMHGIDWKANYAKYLPLVDRVTDRDELDDVIGYMISELSALHSFVENDDLRKGADDVAVASLGARWTRDAADGGYRIDHIYQGDRDYIELLSPLQKPGVGIADGDIVLSVNGVATLSVPDAGALLRNQAGLQTLLRVRHAAGGEPFDRIVVPTDKAHEASLRYSDWELERRRRVDKASDDGIGYVHLRTMGEKDYEQWVRNYYPVINRPGLILDLRHNWGGNIDSWLLSRLMERDWMWWSGRDGNPVPDMQFAAPTHLVVLIDAWTCSDGETMANGVRHLGLGKLIGTRTWGGGIWLSFDNVLVDGGIASAAETGTYIRGEGWALEGKGITPDVIVDNPPAATYRGEDAQLDAAIAYLKAEIARDPHPTPTPPPYPDNSLKPRP